MRFLREQLTVDDILFNRESFKRGDRVSAQYRTFDGENKGVTGTVLKNDQDSVLVREDGTDIIRRYNINNVNPEYVSENPNLDTEDRDFNFIDDQENFLAGKPSKFKYPDAEKEFTFDCSEVYDMFDIAYGTSSDWDDFPEDNQIYKAYLREYFNKFCKLNRLPNSGPFYKFCISRDFDTMFEESLDSTIPTEDNLREWAKDHESGWL